MAANVGNTSDGGVTSQKFNDLYSLGFKCLDTFESQAQVPNFNIFITLWCYINLHFLREVELIPISKFILDLEFVSDLLKSYEAETSPVLGQKSEKS